MVVQNQQSEHWGKRMEEIMRSPKVDLTFGELALAIRREFKRPIDLSTIKRRAKNPRAPQGRTLHQLRTVLPGL